ncbi:lysophospholipid acyltransferase family protein [Haloimpatiens sp. FM7315]|uniref:lysophospholipid acyltransferase family protein n=1 Tax=Haloimpatiens sp. FM7315 TaxID=3298609 RepID=UPI0035A2D03E
MNKLLWYGYFLVFLIFNSVIVKVKHKILMRKSQKLADEYIYKSIKHFSDHILKKSQTKVEAIGLCNIPKEPCVFVCNHQAIFDGFVLISNINKLTGFIAKKEITKLPLIRSWLSAIHSVFIDRNNIREGMKAINQGVQNIKDGYSLVIFPEGTRSLSSKMGEFKRGSMKLATKAKVPIVPITLDGTYRVLEVGNKVTGHKIKMVVHKPIYLDSLTELEKKNLSDNLHDLIESAL